MEAVMNRTSMVSGIALLLAITLVMFSSEASAQKKKTPAKSEQATEQPAPSANQGKLGGMLKDVLLKYKGEKTNLGVLSKVEGDYFVTEEEGVTTIHPLFSIVGIKILKPEEGEEDQAKIEITLLR
jgi:hypothetical protein